MDLERDLFPVIIEEKDNHTVYKVWNGLIDDEIEVGTVTDDKIESFDWTMWLQEPDEDLVDDEYEYLSKYHMQSDILRRMANAARDKAAYHNYMYHELFNASKKIIGENPNKIYECPFCGREKVKVMPNSGKYYVICNCCHAKGSKCNTPEEAIAKWNTRFEDQMY